MIDLHVHSTFSDGTYTPTQLAGMAAEAGLTAMALTDHDSTRGVPEYLAACEVSGVRGIPGVEISANVTKGTLHILGYFIDYKDEGFDASLAQVRSGREDRNVQIVKNLCDIGFELTMEEVAAYAGEDVVGRPHFSNALIDKGYVKDKREAFDKYLAKGKPGYAERFRFSAEESIKSIRSVGGVAVLSHPFTLGLGEAELRAFVGDLVDMGLQGIEVYYSEHGPTQIRQYLKLTEEFGIAAAGGTDFHGDVNPKIHLGVGFGGLKVHDEILVGLENMR